MRILLILIVVAGGVSCGEHSAISKKLSGSDSLVISFTYPGTDSTKNVVQTTDKKAIRKLIGFMGGKNAQQFKCGYDGHMLFFKESKQLMAVVFKYSEEGCRHFLFDIDNVLTSAAMGKEAADFLSSLADGKTYY